MINLFLTIWPANWTLAILWSFEWNIEKKTKRFNFSTDEEVEEVDEEEVEADYAPSETDTTRSDRLVTIFDQSLPYTSYITIFSRPKTKSFTEDEEGLTEGERAMAVIR